MKLSFLSRLTLPALSLAGVVLFSSCAVDQEAALFSQGAASSEKKKEKTTKVKTDSSESWAEKMKAAREEREKERAEAEKKKAQELAAKKKKDETEARKLAYEKKKEEAAKKALAQKEAREKAAAEAEKKALAEKKAREAAKADAEKSLLAEKKAAEKKAREDKYAAEKKRREEERQARIAARKKVEGSRASGGRGNEVAAVANRSGGGFFSSLAVSTPKQYKSKGHHVEINNRALSSLNSSNAKIEISLGQQRARIYNTSGGMEQLVIETQISSGKSGHTTPTGSFRIKEKLEHKRSTLYGRWVNSSGQTVQSSGDSRKRPSGGSTFIGAEMPNWLRITGGIGMHIGYVPNGPASHGCIRVPAAVQPLIFSKVGVGTPVTITY
ncbi:MAG: L,D-transpeptidase family protein [Verrucomicrobiales bacterium]|nr:L,D-transpeptidase family protein [Verrucomicrobiales bacterium]